MNKPKTAVVSTLARLTAAAWAAKPMPGADRSPGAGDIDSFEDRLPRHSSFGTR